MATKQEKLAAIDKKIAALQAQRVTVEAEVEVPVAVVGATINFLFGRGENRKQYSGVVIAEQGGRIKVQYGQGFDTNIVTIGGGDIVADKPEAPAVSGEPEAATTTAAEPTAAQQAEAAALAEASANTAEAAPAATAPATASPEALAALGL